jgi:RHS repeat-associated protein
VLALTALAAVALLGVKGDVNLDGSIGVADVLVLQQALLQQATQGTLPLTAGQQDAADVSLVPSGTVVGNGIVDTGDLAILQSVVLGTGNGTDLAPDYALALGLSPFSTDTNGNGINDGQDDPDGDGLSNRREQWLGLDPLNPYTSGGSIPDGRAVAPALGRNAVTDILTANQFLYTGVDPIQAGVGATAIDPIRVAVVRGTVRNEAGALLPGVSVKVHGHPEYGSTKTLSDGQFDLVVNGGEALTLVFERAGYLESRRTFNTPWRDYVNAPALRLLPIDPGTTDVTLTSPANNTAQVWRGNVVSDSLGNRQPTLIFQPGTTAQATPPSPLSPSPLGTLTIHATESSKGIETAGTDALPLPLPPDADPSYLVELSVDQAKNLGADRVDFQNTSFPNAPVALYIENFLNDPVGEVIENATLNATKTAWVPDGTLPGTVVKIVSIDVGVTPHIANVDTDTTPGADNIGLGQSERERLAGIYPAGQTLARFPLQHFSNWCTHRPFSFPADARDPDPPRPVASTPDNCNERCGSILDSESQVLKEVIPVTGTPWRLHYASERTPGYKAAYQVEIPVTGATIPNSLAEVELDVEVAGQWQNVKSWKQAQYAGPGDNILGPNQSGTFTWNGMTADGRVPQGRQPIHALIRWLYPPAAILRADGSIVPSTIARGKGGRFQYWDAYIGPWDNRAQGLGGWSLTPVHAYDARSNTLYRGDGDRVSAESLPDVIRTVHKTQLNSTPAGIAVSPDGSAWVAEGTTGRVGRIDPLGNYAHFVGKDAPGASCNTLPDDPTPARLLCLKLARDVAVGPDGSLYVADDAFSAGGATNPAGRVWKIAAPVTETSTATLVAKLTNFQTGKIYGIDVGSDGTLYVVADGKVYRYPANGVLGTENQANVVAGVGLGSGTCYGAASAIRATDAQIPFVFDVTATPDGSLYLAGDTCNRVYRVTSDGLLRVFAGNGTQADFDGPNGPAVGDGGQATAAPVSKPTAIAVARDGTAYIATFNAARIRRVGLDGIVSTAVGDGHGVVDGEGGPAARARVIHTAGLTFDALGRLYLTGFIGTNPALFQDSWRVRRIEPALPGFAIGTVKVPSSDGSEVYVFDEQGRIVTTLDSTTYTPKLTFGYVDAGLSWIKDGDNNTVVTVQRHAQTGKPTGITSLFGHHTTLVADGNGWLERIQNPVGDAHVFTQVPSSIPGGSGLLQTYTTPTTKVHTFAYDTLGRLERDDDPALGYQTLARTDTPTGWEVDATTRLGRVTTYGVDRPSVGIENRTLIDPAGLQTTSLRDAGFRETTTDPSGMRSTTEPAADWRLGFTAAFPGRIEIESPDSVTPGGPAGSHFVLEHSQSNTAKSGTGALTTQLDTLNLLNPVTQAVRATGTVFWDALAQVDWNGNSLGKRTTTSFGGRVLEEAVDLRGRVVGSRLGSLHPVKIAYDTKGRVQSITQGPGGAGDRTTIIGYHPTTGRPLSITDAANRVTTFDQYDLAGRVQQMTLPGGRVVAFSYDANGNLASLTPPGQPAHLFRYTPIDQEREYEPPAVAGITDTKTLSDYNFDRQVELVTRPDASTIDPAYEVATGRLDTLGIAQGTFDFVYEATTQGSGGRLQSLVAPNSSLAETVSFGYDGRLPTSITWGGQVSGILTRTFDDDFRAATESVNGAQTVSYGYDVDSLLSSATLGATTFTLTRNPTVGLGTGMVTSTGLGSVATSQSPTPFGELASDGATINSAAVYSNSYAQRDPLGRLTQKVETILNAQGGLDTASYDYTYTPAGQLDTVKLNGASVRDYDYDANGNRTHVNGQLLGAYDAQDRLQSYNGTTHTYTAAGDLSTKTQGAQVTSYTYDAIGNLRHVTLPNATTVDYVIDGQSRRVGKKVNGVLRQGFLYADQLRIAAELTYDAAGMLTDTTRFVYGSKANVPDYMVKGGVTYRILSDHLGSPRLVVNAADSNPATAVVQRIDYDEFGNVTSETLASGFSPTPFGFAGGIYDRDTKLVRFGARDYDAVVGRWTTKDPLRFAGGDANLFAYVLGDPVGAIDPQGLLVGKIGAQASFFVGPGGSVGFGAVAGFDETRNERSLGLYAEGGSGEGFDAGAGIVLGYSSSAEGTSNVMSYSLGIYALSIETDPCSRKITGVSLGISLRGPLPWGASRATVHSRSSTMADLARRLGG